MSKYIIDIPKTVGMGKVGSVHYTYFDGIQCQTIVLKSDEIEELNSDYINEHFSDLQDDAYNKGYAQCQDDYSDALKHAKDTAYKKGLHDGESKCRYCNEYQRGFEDGKAVSDKGCVGCKWEGNGKEHSPCDYCCNCYSNQWTAKQTDDEIKVGDEVYCKGDDTSDSGVVTWVGKKSICAMWQDGSAGELQKDEFIKTGRHFDIASILKEMQS